MEQTYVVRNGRGEELFNTEWGTEWVQAGGGTRMHKGRADAEAKRYGGTAELAESKRFCVLSDRGELRVEGRSARWVPFGFGSRLTKRHAVTLAEAVGGKKKGAGAYVASSESLRRMLYTENMNEVNFQNSPTSSMSFAQKFLAPLFANGTIQEYPGASYYVIAYGELCAYDASGEMVAVWSASVPDTEVDINPRASYAGNWDPS